MTLRATAAALTLLLASTGCDRAEEAPARAGNAAPAAMQGSAAPAKKDTPALVVNTLENGRYDLAERRGKWVVVNFWATWCAPCLKELPDLSALDAKREDVEVIGLAYEEIEPADLRAFLQKRPVVYPIAIVDLAAPPAGFETPRGLPMTYLISPDGHVVKKFLGPVTGQDIETEIARHGRAAA